ncbi:MAG: TIM barrel protein, partial [Verrucomicrobiota bacterium]|nr:TIM barrel protein [Verrucomicrobiota bacterium]
LKPHIAAAEKANLTIAIENHGNNLMDSPDSMKWLIELAPSKHLGIALAPYHLESLGVDADGHAKLIKALGKRIAMFYAWQHGMGCSKKLPKEQERLQMPGRGKLDFVPLMRALKQINYSGFTSIFMHPVPRGIPILPTASGCTTEINRARTYLKKCLTEV